MTDDDEGLGIEVEDDENTGEWITTFADMTTLLLTFFIMLYSMSSLDQHRFDTSFGAIKQSLGGKGDISAVPRSEVTESMNLADQISLRRKLLQEQGRLFAEYQQFQNGQGLQGLVTANMDKGKITLRISSDVMFDSGSAELTEEGKAVLATLKTFLAKHNDQSINIKGYTDDQPPKAGSRFRDNWELSAMRAVNVLRFMAGLGLDPKRFTATGLADMEPVFPNNSPENRARNRRVEFVLEKDIGE